MSCLAIAGLGPHELPQTERRAVAKAGADEACTAMLALMRGECGGPADAAKAKARSVVAGATNDPLVQQLLDNNAHLKAELNRMELKCATAEGIALGKAPYMEDLHNQLKAANEQIAQLRLAHSKSDKEAAEEIASLKATNEALRCGERTKAPGEGRGPGLAKIEEEPAYETLKPDVLEGCDFLMHWQITSPAMLHLKLGDYDVRRLKAYWPEDKQSTKRQSKQRAECFWNLLSLDTGKWPVGDADALFAYMMSTQDLGTQPGEFHSRKHQLATWLWPSRITDHASLVDKTAASKYMDRRANLYMTGVRGVHALYEIYQGKRAMPSGHVEGVDPIPERGPKRQQKRKAEAQEVARDPDLYVDGCEGDDATMPDGGGL